MASITKNQFFGEEYLLKKDKREYSAVVRASETLAYSLDYPDYRAMREEFAQLFEGFREQALERFNQLETGSLNIDISKKLPIIRQLFPYGSGLKSETFFYSFKSHLL